MGLPHPHPPTLLIAAIFSRHGQALDWAVERIAASWGSILAASERFEFTETAYYNRLMGEGLRKQLVAVAGDFDPAQLADIKLQSNAWEAEFAALHNYPEPRPLNIDPGYLTPMKVVLASTKDRAHRIYLHDGIYAEECLYYHNRSWQGRPWTYPDYMRSDYHAFLLTVRDQLQARLGQLKRAAGAQNQRVDCRSPVAPSSPEDVPPPAGDCGQAAGEQQDYVPDNAMKENP